MPAPRRVLLQTPTELTPPVVEFTDHGTVSRISLAPEFVTGLLEPFGGRARIVLAALLNGYSERMAAVQAGISGETVRQWRLKDPKFAEACQKALDAGFARVFESELYDRALDREDRGSMRALELVVKARSADYREKTQAQISVIHAAADAFGAASAWKALPEADTSQT